MEVQLKVKKLVQKNDYLFTTQGLDIFVPIHAPKYVKFQTPRDEEEQIICMTIEDGKVQKISYKGVEEKSPILDKPFKIRAEPKQAEGKKGLFLRLGEVMLRAKSPSLDGHLFRQNAITLSPKGVDKIVSLEKNDDEPKEQRFDIKSDWKVDVKNKKISNSKGLEILFKTPKYLEGLDQLDGNLVARFEYTHNRLSLLGFTNSPTDLKLKDFGVLLDTDYMHLKNGFVEIETLEKDIVRVKARDFNIFSDRLYISDDNITG